MAANLPASRRAVGQIARGGEREFPLSEADYRYLTSVVYDQSGIVLGPNKVDMVYSRLVRRLRELGLESFRAYCELVQQPDGDAELGRLINAITTNLTRLFREPHHFDHLGKELAKAGETSSRLRIWSAGCSSGEEPHSIAITLLETFPDLARRDAKVLATDLDTNMVATARAGIYQASAVAELPKKVQRYFEQTGAGADSVIAADKVRRLLTFKQLNLLGEWPMRGPFDAIFCRNVMIYFDGPTKSRLVERYADMLKPGGCLYIGHSETLLDHHADLTLTGPTVYRKGGA